MNQKHLLNLEVFNWTDMAPRKGGTANKGGSKAAPKKRVAANGFKLPDPIAPGVIVTDIAKKSWRIGNSIGKLRNFLVEDLFQNRDNVLIVSNVKF